MGMCLSSNAAENLERNRATLKALGLQGSVGSLTSLHDKLSAGEKGKVGLFELLMGASMDRTPFIEKSFSAFDLNGDGTLDFREFVFALWNFMTLDRSGLALFLFDIYDRDQSGDMSKKELETAITDALGKQAMGSGPAKQLVDRTVRASPNGKVTRATFLEMMLGSSELMYPAVRAQMDLSKIAFGMSFWGRLAQRRLQQASTDAAYSPVHWRALAAKLLENDLHNRVMQRKLSSKRMSRQSMASSVRSTGDSARSSRAQYDSEHGGNGEGGAKLPAGGFSITPL